MTANCPHCRNEFECSDLDKQTAGNSPAVCPGFQDREYQGGLLNDKNAWV
jgi:hypothetical protein